MANTITVNGIVYGVIGLIDPNTGALLSKAEDTAHASGDGGIPALAVRKDAAAALAGSDGDYTPLICDGSGRLWIRNVGADPTNNVQKTADVWAPGNAPISTSGQLIAAGVYGGGFRARLNNDHATNKSTFQFYDNTSATGTKIGGLITLGALQSVEVFFPVPIAIGVWCVIGGTGTPEAYGMSKAAA